MEPITILLIVILCTSPYAIWMATIILLLYRIFIYQPEEHLMLAEERGNDIPSLISEEPEDNGWGTPVNTPWDTPITDFNNHLEWGQAFGWTRADIRNTIREYDMWNDDWTGEADAAIMWDPTDGTAMDNILTFREMAMAYAAPAPPAVFHMSHRLSGVPTPRWMIPTTSNPIGHEAYIREENY